MRYICLFECIPKNALVDIHIKIKTTGVQSTNTENGGWENKEFSEKGKMRWRKRGGLLFESAFFLLSTLPATSSSAHGGLFLNNPTLGFHHSFEMIHVQLSNICLLF